MSDTRPYLITDQDAGGRMLNPLPSKDKVFQEAWLQELLFKHPSILPVGQFDEAYAPPISLGREIASIDNLIISPSGLLTVVETKLWRNPEAHRTVVAQILEYAKNLTSWDYDSVDKAVKAYMTKRYGQPKSIYSTKGHAFSQAASRKARRKDFQKTFVFSYFRGYLKNFLPEKAQILLITD